MRDTIDESYCLAEYALLSDHNLTNKPQNHMKNTQAQKVAIILLTGSLATTSIYGVEFSTVGTYDKAVNTNVVDVNATGTLSAFTTEVATAYSNNLGGVITFDNVTPTGNTHSAEFGTSGGNFLQFTSSNLAGFSDAGSFTPISGSLGTG
jgi:hypothetical protein